MPVRAVSANDRTDPTGRRPWAACTSGPYGWTNLNGAGDADGEGDDDGEGEAERLAEGEADEQPLTRAEPATPKTPRKNARRFM